MEKLYKNINYDINKLERKFMSASYSKKKNLVYEFGSLVSLLDILGIDQKLVYDYKLANKIIGSFLNEIKIYLREFEQLADDVIKMYKDNNFIYYRNPGNLYLSHNDKLDLLRSFLEYYCQDAYQLYLDLLDQGKIFVASNDVAGESFSFDSIKSRYLMVSDVNMDSIMEIETVIHELMHLYCSKFLQNYTVKYMRNFYNGFYYETVPLYSELSFYDFMKKEGINNFNLEMHRNLIDRYILEYFLTIKYLAKIAEREDVTIILGDFDYHVIKNKENDKPLSIDTNETNPMYMLNEKYANGRTVDFIYAMSSIAAARLIEKERINKISPKMLINEYLLTFGDDEMLLKDLTSRNIDDLSNDIKKRIKR